jgi:D-methionine transport system ATP-binding protein
VEEIFRNPQTKIGQELVLHEGTNREAYTGKLPYCYRLVFKGGSENEPVLGRMMIETKGVASIMITTSEDTKVIYLSKLRISEDRFFSIPEITAAISAHITYPFIASKA